MSKEKIKQLLDESMFFNMNDVLVDANAQSVVAYEEDKHFALSEVKQLIAKAKEVRKESGVNPLCVAKSVLHWTYKDKEISTPIFIFPCEEKIDKVNQKVSFHYEESSLFINPFLLATFHQEFGLKLDESSPLSSLIAHGFEVIDENVQWLGNFHPHRYEQIKELDKLLQVDLADNVEQILGNESNLQEKMPLCKDLLFSSDNDQNLVYEQLQLYNLVVQGPPGTGKSQVLSNTIAKIIEGNYHAVLLSEKRVALEVIQKKLSEKSLGHLCYIATNDSSTKIFLKELKSAWMKAEKTLENSPTNLRLSEQYLHKLQMQIDLMKNEKLFGGVSFKVFKQQLNNADLQHITYFSQAPELKEFLDHLEIFAWIFQHDLQLILSCLKPSVFKQNNLGQLDEKIDEILNLVKECSPYFQLNIKSDIENAMRQAAMCQFFTTDIYLKHQQFFNSDKKTIEKFKKYYKQWLQLESKLQAIEKINWKIEPSIEETKTLIQLSEKKGVLAKLKFNRVWKKYVLLPSLSTGILQQHLQYLQLLQEKKQLTVSFSTLSIHLQLDDVHGIFHQLHQLPNKEELKIAQRSQDEIQKIAQYNAKLNHLNLLVKTYFQFDDSSNFVAIITELRTKFELILQQQELAKLSNASFYLLAKSEHIDVFKAFVLKATEVNFVRQFAGCEHLSSSSLLTQAEQIIHLQAEESDLFSQQISKKIAQKFQEYHELLSKPTTKLSQQEKALKKQLKNGKAILVKAFAKSRNLPSFRELFSSDAKIWIKLLKPIWLCNPMKMSRIFPLERELFDFAIFDEASQIVLGNSLGTIQRAKRILIAGDSQQMSPSFYFQAKSEGVVDVLHQASFYWKNVHLKHHYRSEQAALISFSNQYFYQNELIVFPSYPINNQVVFRHFVEQGTYLERENIEEAKAVARHLSQEIDSKQSLGIVAFSETQLRCIFDQLSNEVQQKVLERIENNNLFFKSLENIQGEECDHLIISLAYGKDENGILKMRFGPLNQKNGNKRLNVLLTRAKKKVHFFTSLVSSDFKISSNENVELLRKYLFYIENQQNTIQTQWPYQVEAQIEKNLLNIPSIYASISDANELVTFVKVMKQRKWNLQFID